MELLSARSHRELLEILAVTDLHVPARGDKEDKRQTQHTERWSICRFLATYGNTRFVRYPLIVEKRERPDFRLNSRGLEVGIEVTEAVSEDMARIDAMRNAADEDIALDVSLFRPGMPRRTTQELREILEQSRTIATEADDSQDDFDPIHSRWMGPGLGRRWRRARLGRSHIWCRCRQDSQRQKAGLHILRKRGCSFTTTGRSRRWISLSRRTTCCRS